MSSNSLSSFVNGLIAGAGIALALMSYGFMKFTSGLENIQGVTSTELRIAILLGGIVAAASIGYEFYTKKDIVQQTTKDTEIIEELPKVSEHDKIDIKESKTEDSENSFLLLFLAKSGLRVYLIIESIAFFARTILKSFFVTRYFWFFVFY